MIEGFPRIRVFVSSPNDVTAERAVATRVVIELNALWSEVLGFNIEVIRWETHGYPAAGSDAQAVLNEQLGNDHDIFLGILWSRFGTPTPRAESGTEEEFKRAYQNRSVPDGRPAIMLYFKEAALPFDVNIDQLAKVRSFREGTRNLGLLDWSFSDTEQFESLLRFHLSRTLQKIARAWRNASDGAKLIPATGATGMSADLRETSEWSASETERSTRATERVTLLIRQMTQLMSAETVQLNAIRSTGSMADAMAFTKRSVERVSKCMTEFAERLRFELPTFRLSRANGSLAYGRLAAIISTLVAGGMAAGYLSSLLQALTESEVATASALPTLAEYRMTVSNLPAMLDQPKKNLGEALAAYEYELTISLKLLREVIDSIREMVNLASSSGPASSSPAVLGSP